MSKLESVIGVRWVVDEFRELVATFLVDEKVTVLTIVAVTL